MKFSRLVLLLIGAVILGGSGGCAASLGGFVVQSPNGGTPNAARQLVDPAVRSQNGVDRFYLLDVGPPAAEIGILQKEPLPVYAEPRGTILVLHGLGGESLWMMHFADKFAEDGYRVFLIDEFQDTDPLQVDIALAFATDFATDPGTGQIEPGRLFLVGDPKQSIYRFRRADMAAYAATRGAMATAGAGLPQLVLNRRSRPEVLGFVNTVFAALIGAGERPEVQPPYRPVHPEREERLAGPGVGWTGQGLDLPAREARRRRDSVGGVLTR